ncbi:MAG: helicase-related protein, partial [Anaerolineae bacterium]|nr:helicase-related protein [Anaerolineae bacterium]
LSLGKVQDELPGLRRYRTLIIDESHNLTNRNAKRYQAIEEYIQLNDPQVILLTATPYNKRLADLGSQLRLFLDEQKELPTFPQRYLDAQRAQGESEQAVAARIQAPLNSLRCFDRSEFAEDWRDLMRHYLIRRTRSFIIKNYAQFDDHKRRHFVRAADGKRFYFPERQPRTVKVPLGDTLYDKLYSDDVLALIEQLTLARYGLARYLNEDALRSAPKEVTEIAADLTRAGQRLIGFARTSLFKRLESSGRAFLLSVERQILRNAVALHAIAQDEPLPIGKQDIARFDPATQDTDDEFADDEMDSANETKPIEDATLDCDSPRAILQALHQRAGEIYRVLRSEFARRFRWMPTQYFNREALRRDLEQDNRIFAEILHLACAWRDDDDPKFVRLLELVQKDHGTDKVLVFTQFADTAEALGKYLRRKGVVALGVVTSETDDPSALARRFSPRTNGDLRNGETPLRVLIATDTLSEGQNLQDCHIVVNFDLPWAIVRLIQRAGRVDRIGQTHPTITVYSFLPAEGIEQIIRLRQMLSRRLQENQEVIGTDETFFDEQAARALEDLYTEKAHVLSDAEEDSEVDLTSRALEVWQSAPEAMRQRALALPPQVYVTRANDIGGPDGAIVFARLIRGSERDDRLIRVDDTGERLEHSLAAVFEAMRCDPDAKAIDNPDVLDLVYKASQIIEDEAQSGSLVGMLGSPRSLRARLYHRLQRLAEASSKDSDLSSQAGALAERLHQFALCSEVEARLRAALQTGIGDEDLVALLANLDAEDKLVISSEPSEARVEILCTMGLKTR